MQFLVPKLKPGLQVISEGFDFSLIIPVKISIEDSTENRRIIIKTSMQYTQSYSGIFICLGYGYSAVNIRQVIE